VEIADKAIVCYRCGAPTAAPGVSRDARRGPARSGRGRAAAVLLAVVALAVVLLLLWLRR
jgi:hypothetical protein